MNQPTRFSLATLISNLQAAAQHYGVRSGLSGMAAWRAAQRLATEAYGVPKVQQVPALVDYACLAILTLDAPLLFKVSPNVCDLIANMGPLPMPARAPQLLRGGWLISASDPDKGERLFGNTVSMGGYVQEPSGTLILMGSDEATDECHVVPWRPRWGQGHAADHVTREVSSHISDSDSFYAWGTQAAEFTLRWAMLPELPHINLRITADGRPPRRRRSTTRSCPAM